VHVIFTCANGTVEKSHPFKLCTFSARTYQTVRRRRYICSRAVLGECSWLWIDWQ